MNEEIKKSNVNVIKKRKPSETNNKSFTNNSNTTAILNNAPKKVHRG